MKIKIIFFFLLFLVLLGAGRSVFSKGAWPENTPKERGWVLYTACRGGGAEHYKVKLNERGEKVWSDLGWQSPNVPPTFYVDYKTGRSSNVDEKVQEDNFAEILVQAIIQGGVELPKPTGCLYAVNTADAFSYGTIDEKEKAKERARRVKIICDRDRDFIKRSGDLARKIKVVLAERLASAIDECGDPSPLPKPGPACPTGQGYRNKLDPKDTCQPCETGFTVTPDSYCRCEGIVERRLLSSQAGNSHIEICHSCDEFDQAWSKEKKACKACGPGEYFVPKVGCCQKGTDWNGSVVVPQCTPCTSFNNPPKVWSEKNQGCFKCRDDEVLHTDGTCGSDCFRGETVSLNGRECRPRGCPPGQKEKWVYYNNNGYYQCFCELGEKSILSLHGNYCVKNCPEGQIIQTVDGNSQCKTPEEACTNGKGGVSPPMLCTDFCRKQIPPKLSWANGKCADCDAGFVLYKWQTYEQGQMVEKRQCKPNCPPGQSWQWVRSNNYDHGHPECKNDDSVCSNGQPRCPAGKKRFTADGCCPPENQCMSSTPCTCVNPACQ